MFYPKRRRELARMSLVLLVGLLCLLPVWAIAQEEGAEEADAETALQEQLQLVPSLPLKSDENFEEVPEVGGGARDRSIQAGRPVHVAAFGVLGVRSGAHPRALVHAQPGESEHAQVHGQDARRAA
jgi:hypothetical protein